MTNFCRGLGHSDEMVQPFSFGPRGISGQQGYADVGKNAFYQLAGLAGINGYRTPEEIAYTEHTKAGPPGSPTLGTSTVDKSQFNRDGLPGLLDKSKNISMLGDSIGGVTAFYGHKKRQQSVAIAAQQDANNAASQAKYKTDLAAWNDQNSKLKSASDTSLQNYSPTSSLEQRPGYQFRVQQGLKATNAMSSAQHDVLSGAGVARLNDYAQGQASNEYGNEFNRLLTLSGIGQNATTAQGNIGIGAGSNLANLNLQSGQNASNYYNNLNDLTQGSANNLAYLGNRNNSTPTGSSYDPNSPTSNPNYKPGQTLDPSLYH